MIEIVDSPEPLPAEKPPRAVNEHVLTVARWCCLAGIGASLMLGAGFIHWAADGAVERPTGLNIVVSGRRVEPDAAGYVYVVLTFVGLIAAVVGAVQVNRSVRPGSSGLGFAVFYVLCLYLLPVMWICGVGAWGRRHWAPFVMTGAWLAAGVLGGSVGPVRFGLAEHVLDATRIAGAVAEAVSFAMLVVALGCVLDHVRGARGETVAT